MSLSPWWLLLLALPLLLLGQYVLRSVPALARFSIPVPVVGGLLFALACLLLRLAGLDLTFATKVDAPWWTWLVTPDTEWLARPAKNLNSSPPSAFGRRYAERKGIPSALEVNRAPSTLAGSCFIAAPDCAAAPQAMTRVPRARILIAATTSA